MTTIAGLKQDSSHVVGFLSIASSLIACSCSMDGLELLTHHTKAIDFFSQTIAIVAAIAADAIVLSY